MKTAADFRILTLNFWGLPRRIATHRDIRLTSLIHYLLQSDSKYDVICLQEIWDEDDYETLRTKLLSKFPYIQYYSSFLIGSGLVVLSLHPIESVLFHRYSLNGYPYRVTHGDWFCGKGVALAVLRVDQLQLNVYTTHMHANYSPSPSTDNKGKAYNEHRTTQALELSQFVASTSHGADVVFVAGDLNAWPQSLQLRLIKSLTGLRDAFGETFTRGHLDSQDANANEETPSASECELDPYDRFYAQQRTTAEVESLRHEEMLAGATCNRPECPYRDGGASPALRDGERIDYVLYRSSAGSRAELVDCSLCLGEVPNLKVNGRPLLYSDHMAVSARFRITAQEASSKAVKTSGPSSSEHRVAALKEARELLTAFVGRLGRDRQRVSLVALLALLLLALIPLLFARVTTAGIPQDLPSLGEATAGFGGGRLGSGIGAITQIVSLIDSLGRSADAFHALQEGSPLPSGFNLKDLEVPPPAYRLKFAVRLYLVAVFLSLITALLAIVFVWALVVRCISKPVENRLVRGHLANIDLLLSLEKSSS